MQFQFHSNVQGGERIFQEKFMAVECDRMRVWAERWVVVTAPLHVDVNLLPHIAVALLIFPFNSHKTRNFPPSLQLTLLPWHWGREHHSTFTGKKFRYDVRLKWHRFFIGRKKHPMDDDDSLAS
jgi:hypothetical protein